VFLAIAVDNLANAQELTAAEEADEKNNEPRVSGGWKMNVLFIYPLPQASVCAHPGSISMLCTPIDHLLVLDMNIVCIEPCIF
jgi:hypothetical protein